MSTPDGDYEVDYRLEVEPVMVDEEGWPVESRARKFIHHHHLKNCLGA